MTIQRSSQYFLYVVTFFRANICHHNFKAANIYLTFTASLTFSFRKTFIFLLPLNRLSVPDEEKHSESMIVQPTCFTAGMHVQVYVQCQLTVMLPYAYITKSLILVLSDSSTFFCMFTVSLWLATKCTQEISFNNSFLLSTLPKWPHLQRAQLRV